MVGLLDQIQARLSPVEEVRQFDVEEVRQFDDLPQSSSQTVNSQPISPMESSSDSNRPSSQTDSKKSYIPSSENSSLIREEIKLKKDQEKRNQQKKKYKSGTLATKYNKAVGDETFDSIFDHQLEAYDDIDNLLKEYGFYNLSVIETATKPMMSRQDRNHLVFTLVSQSKKDKLKKAYKKKDTNWNRRLNHWFTDDWSDYALFGQVIKVYFQNLISY